MLTKSQKNHFHEEGYLMVPGVVPDDLCDAVIEAILEYSSIDMDDESTWCYRDVDGHGIIPLHHDQALWDLRQCPALHQVFSDLYETDDLWVSNDRVSCKSPTAEQSKDWHRERIHWDCDPWTYDQLGMQGLVYLTDTDKDQGAFSCVPSIFKNLKRYLVEHEADGQWRYPNVGDEDLVRVAGLKGSLVIFDRLMPHTSDLNHSDQHRFVQYVTMAPAVEKLRKQVVREWREKLLPDWALSQAISGGKVKEEGPPPELTDLGRKLVGLDRW
jgi:hypothetical protein